jgi:hypothetical protein
MLVKFGFIIRILIVTEMLGEPYAKQSASLSDILHVAVRAERFGCDLVESSLLIVFCVVNVILTEESLKSFVINLVCFPM